MAGAVLAPVCGRTVGPSPLSGPSPGPTLAEARFSRTKGSAPGSTWTTRARSVNVWFDRDWTLTSSDSTLESAANTGSSSG